MAAGATREVLDRQHLGYVLGEPADSSASHALAEARHEAAMFGVERRERIRRLVREAEVLREVERMGSEDEGKAE
jgi:hypothetical protein